MSQLVILLAALLAIVVREVECKTCKVVGQDCPALECAEVQCPNDPTKFFGCTSECFLEPNGECSGVTPECVCDNSCDCREFEKDCALLKCAQIQCPNDPSKSYGCLGKCFQGPDGECTGRTPECVCDDSCDEKTCVQPGRDCPALKCAAKQCPNDPTKSYGCLSTCFEESDGTCSGFTPECVCDDSCGCNTPGVDCPALRCAAKQCPNDPSKSYGCLNMCFLERDGTCSGRTPECVCDDSCDCVEPGVDCPVENCKRRRCPNDANKFWGCTGVCFKGPDGVCSGFTPKCSCDDSCNCEKVGVDCKDRKCRVNQCPNDKSKEFGCLDTCFFSKSGKCRPKTPKCVCDNSC